MKKLNLKRIALISLLLSLTAFFLDMNERVDNIFTNAFEILMLSGLLFLIISGTMKVRLFLKTNSK